MISRLIKRLLSALRELIKQKKVCRQLETYFLFSNALCFQVNTPLVLNTFLMDQKKKKNMLLGATVCTNIVYFILIYVLLYVLLVLSQKQRHAAIR